MIAKVKIIEGENPDIGILEEAASLILKGEVIVCPTDTGYAFAANALDEAAIRKVFALKTRIPDKPIHMAVSNIDQAEKYAYVNEIAKALAKRFLPGALTLVLPRREIVPSLLTAGLDTVGIRIPDNQTILALARMADRPLTTTSANVSGQPSTYKVEEILSQLGSSVKDLALILDEGEIPPLGVSTIVDLSTEPYRILRQGLISEVDIREVIPHSGL